MVVNVYICRYVCKPTYIHTNIDIYIYIYIISIYIYLYLYSAGLPPRPLRPHPMVSLICVSSGCFCCLACRLPHLPPPCVPGWSCWLAPPRMWHAACSFAWVVDLWTSFSPPFEQLADEGRGAVCRTEVWSRYHTNLMLRFPPCKWCPCPCSDAVLPLYGLPHGGWLQ